MKIKNLLLLLTATFITGLLLTGCCFQHEWIDATCTTPKTCSKCQKTDGEPLGHSWNDATCTEPQTCSVCETTEGEALGHTPGSWKAVKEATLTSSGEEDQFCTVCEEVIDTKSTYKEIEHKAACFNFSGKEFAEYVQDHINSDYVILTSNPLELGKLTVYGIYQKTEPFLYYGYKENSKGQVDTLAIGALNSTTKTDALAFGALVAELIDSSINETEFLTYLYYKEEYSHNGIDYLFGELDDSEYAMFFMIPQ